MAPQTWFITGASRGIGLELVKQLAVSGEGHTIIAACRSPISATALKSVGPGKGKIYIVQMDVVDEQSIKSGVKEVEKILGGNGVIDYLINNAGVGCGDEPFEIRPDVLMNQFKTHVVGPSIITQLLIPYVERSQRKVVINFTSGLSSIGLDFGTKCASYSVSKTALNMLTYKFAKAKPEVIFFVIDPGWVKTDLGGPNAMLEVDVAVRNLLQVFKDATLTQSGKLLHYTGKELPW